MPRENVTPELEAAQEQLQADTEAISAAVSAEIPAESRLQKALTALGLRKASGGSTTEIIGHPGAPAEGVQATEYPFGTNQFDESRPNGEAPEQTTEESIDADAAHRIDANRAHGREPGAQGGGDLAKAAATAQADALYTGLAKADAQGSLREAIDASPALEMLTDTLVKGLGDILGELKALGARVTAVEGLQKSLADGTAALIETQTESMEALQKNTATIMAQPRERQPFPGIALISGTAPRGTAMPEGVTKATVMEALQKSVNAQQMSPDTFNRLAPKLDTTYLPDLWAQLPEQVRDLTLAK
jgi:hypothetical protein